MAAPGRALDSEALTRRTRIDAALRESGWHIVPHLPGTPFSAYHHAAVTEFPTANGPADYALIANNRILAIVEAKRSGLAIQEVLTQAQRYARGIQQLDLQYGEYGVPFLFSANGQAIRFLDVRDPANTARDLAKFPMPAALEERLTRGPATAFVRLQSLANDNPRLRPYQREANDAVEAAQAVRAFAHYQADQGLKFD